MEFDIFTPFQIMWKEAYSFNTLIDILKYTYIWCYMEDKKKKFEVRTEPTKDKFFQRNIYIDGEYFDWEIDESSLDWAKAQGPVFFEATKKDIAKHFLDSLSEMVGRKITLEAFQLALKTGWI